MRFVFPPVKVLTFSATVARRAATMKLGRNATVNTGRESIVRQTSTAVHCQLIQQLNISGLISSALFIFM